MYIKGDFHIHSSESDGALKPGEIVLLAKERNIDIISLTDHNTVKGNKQAIVVGNIHGVKVIPGIELSTRYHRNQVHILGYFYNDFYKSKEFNETLELINCGKFKMCRTKYKRYILEFKSEENKLTTMAGVEFLKYSGAKVVLAHPTLLKRDVFESLIKLNFDGIEAKYYRNKENETEYFIEVAKKKGIVYTAGSDFHSLKKNDLKHGTLGQIYLEEEEIKEFLKMF
ncbi:PHP domain-containing protein [Clostridium sp. HBUAS56017]|uniref:PHP domain-containing protein n=2 Tax=Clostridium TaxID=1485 RepID=UPI0011777AF4|nr:PHP domain-containing protein [Clostridium sp. HBUAS56017]